MRNWPDILRVAATLASGVLPPSQLLRKFAAYPRQHELAVALREIGRVERTLFIVDWLLDTDMQRRANTGLNKGEAHHALKNALRIGRQGEIRDRTSEGQHYRMAGLNLLAAIVIYWNTAHLGEAVRQRRLAGLTGRPRAPGPHLTPWVGPRPAHRRIPVAKASVAPLAYDSAPYLNRPGNCLSSAETPGVVFRDDPCSVAALRRVSVPLWRRSTRRQGVNYRRCCSQTVRSMHPHPPSR